MVVCVVIPKRKDPVPETCHTCGQLKNRMSVSHPAPRTKYFYKLVNPKNNDDRGKELTVEYIDEHVHLEGNKLYAFKLHDEIWKLTACYSSCGGYTIVNDPYIKKYNTLKDRVERQIYWLQTHDE